MAWQVVAEGVSLSELRQTVGDMELPKGTRMKVVMDTPVAWAFDIAGAEWVFQPYIPEGMTLIDVYGEGGQGIVDMEADPAWLVAVLAFIKAHWLAIIIAGFVLTAIISFVRVWVEVIKAPTPFPAIAVLAGIAIFILLAKQKPTRERSP